MKEVKDEGRRDLLKAGGAMAAMATAAALLPVREAAAQKKEQQWAMVFDLRRCVGCGSCQVSCKMENRVPMGRFNAKVDIFDRGAYPKPERFFVPTMCNHCAGEKGTPPCVEVCPMRKAGEWATMNGVRYQKGATYKRPDGLIVTDESLCIGCYLCIKACPYGARYIHPHIKLTHPGKVSDLGISKCNFCDHRLDQGLEPACVRNCMGRARIYGDLNDPGSEVAQLIKDHDTTVLYPEKNTKPQVYFIQLDGTVAKTIEPMNAQK